MLFNSLAFAVFLPIAFFLYWHVFNRSLKVQNLFVLVASYVFYGFWDWRFLTLIFSSSLIDYFVGLKISTSKRQIQKRNFLLISLIVNLGLLGFFKYFNFFVDSFIALFGNFGIQLNEPSLQILLPVGISFYTFQTLSYTIDIYRGKMKPSRDPIAFFAFVSFFPQLVAGPIERAADLLPQFAKNRKFNYAFSVTGLRLILWGMFKKVVVADNLARFVAVVYSSPEDYYGISILLAMLMFTIQVYCDFSGYSDIAIGVARLFGFKLTTNFRVPLLSKSMKEFWSRWHITLSTWFRDYLYIPLGGNRHGRLRWFFALFITFLISGLWHGASWAFVIWGALNGLYLIAEIVLKDAGEKANRILKIKKFPFIHGRWRNFVTFNLFAFSLLIFRAESGEDAWVLIQHLFQSIPTQLTDNEMFRGLIQEIFISKKELTYLSLSILILILIDIRVFRLGVDRAFGLLPIWPRRMIYLGLVVWFLIFGAFAEPQQFVYFQF